MVLALALALVLVLVLLLGDSALTARGREYALRLAKFADDVIMLYIIR